jgi:serine protease Do
VNDQPVSGPSDLTRRIASTPPGTRAPVTIVRDGGRKTVQVELGRLPERAQQPPPR